MSNGGFDLDDTDLRLIAALQCDGRLPLGQVASVLGLSPRVVHRRWSGLLSSGAARVVCSRPRPPAGAAMMLRLRVAPGQAATVARALAAREDIPLVDLSASGDQVLAVALADPAHRDRLVFRQLPATKAVTAVDAQTIIHAYSDASDWRLDVLTMTERTALTRPRPPASEPAELDETDARIAGVLAGDGRAAVSFVARRVAQPESSVRRRIAGLLARGQLTTRVLVDPVQLGFRVDANVLVQVPPGDLDRLGRRLAGHPAAHGVLATTGTVNLMAAVWLRDLDHLYQFITADLGSAGVASIETVLIGENVKRPASW
jgi:DNA-binding Lrp family transcriptional regulator